MSKLIIFGAGDIARLAYHYFTHDSKYEVVAFAVDKEYRKTDSLFGLPVLDFETVKEKFKPSEYEMFVALSYSKMNKIRAEKYYLMKKLGYNLASYISSKCTFLTENKVGDNCFILENNTIQPFAKIGNNITLWSGNHIGHDSIIDDHCFISSHVVVSGHVHIKQYCFIGVNATLRDSITIAPESLIGAGSIIMRDTIEQGVYLPERAKISEKKSSDIDM